MKFRRRRQPDSLHINLTSLIDTVFLLLIFFMMTTTFNRETQLNIDLPQATGEPLPMEPQEPIRIIIDANGEYAINDNEHHLVDTQLETLKSALQDLAGGQSNPRLLISADDKAPHHAVITAMQAARDLGYVRLSFETQQRPESPSSPLPLLSPSPLPSPPP
jgi:biopolymer transport protein ExbD